MNLLISSFLLSSIVITGSTFLLIGTHASAQITPDNTLGTERSRVTPNAELRNGRIVNQRIDGGAQRGENLFHSFREFNVGNLESVYFSNPAGVRNILTRVTGRNYSDIQGILGVDGRANLFLLNPNGILFGENAQLDLQGSFLATTADRFVFPDGFEFGVNDPQAPPLLTVTTPIGLQYGNRPGVITVDGAFLFVDSGQTLELAGGDVTVSNSPYFGILDLDIEDGQRPSRGGGVLISADSLLVRTSVLSTVTFNQNNAGDIIIDANSVSIDGGSQLSTATLNQGNAGNIEIRATDSVEIDAEPSSILLPSALITSSEQEATGIAGDIVINTSNFQITNGAVLDTSTYSSNAGDIYINSNIVDIRNGGQLLTDVNFLGNAGNIIIDAVDRITITGVDPLYDVREGMYPRSELPGLLRTVGRNSALYSEAITRGNSGTVRLATSKVEISDEATIATSASLGRAGNLLIDATDSVTVRNGFLVGSVIDSEEPRRISNWHIEAERFLFQDGSRLTVSTSGESDAGSLSITAEDLVRIDSSSFITTSSNAVGNSGDITINADQIIIESSPRLDSTIITLGTSGDGNAGNLALQASNIIDISGAFISTGSTEEASGDGGEILFTADRIRIRDGGTVTTLIQGPGQAGDIQFISSESVHVLSDNELSSIGAQIDDEVGNETAGLAGDISIRTPRLIVRDSLISTSTFSEGDGGNISLLPYDSEGAVSNIIRVSGRGEITTEVQEEATGDAGDLYILAGRLVIDNGAQVGSGTFGEGQSGLLTAIVTDRITIDGSGGGLFTQSEGAGNAEALFIETENLYLRNGAQVSSATYREGQAGNLIIHLTGELSLEGDSQIVAGTAGQGDAGNIEIAADTLSASQGGRIRTDILGLSSGDAGDIRLRINNDLTLNGIDTGILASTKPDSSGDGGAITISAAELDLQNRAEIAVTSRGTGEAGDMELQAASVSLNDHASLNAETNSSSGGNIDLQIADSLFLDSSSKISASTNDGQAGRIGVNLNSDPVNLIQLLNTSSISSQANGRDGDAGAVNLNTLTLDLQDNSVISAATLSGDGGNIRLRGLESLDVLDSQIIASTRSGAGGDIRITALDSIQLDESSISVEARDGTAGDLILNVAGIFSLDDGSQVSASARGEGDAGDIEIVADTLNVLQGSQIQTTTDESGDAGDIWLRIANDLNLVGADTGIFASTDLDSSGDGGAITIRAADLDLQNRAAIAVTSQGTGEAGDIEIQADSVNLRAHASLSAETNSSSGGNIGLQIADSLLLDNSSEISASTNDGRAGQIQTNLGSEPVGLIRLLNNSSISSQANGPDGDAGTVNLNTLDLDLQGNSVISATTISGDGGNIRLRGLENLNVTDSEILASTRSGAGGDIRITALDSIQLDDQGNISAEAEETGRAGDLQIRTEQLAVQDSSEISVSSPAGEAGSLAVNADVVELDRGFLRAEVGGENASGAEISLNLAREGLELRNNSQITARAENNANGGNVTINALNGFVLAPSGDNDIIASAFLGQGGNIEIASQAIFGFAERPAIPGNGTNDIDASSQFGSAGTVNLDSPVDPVQQVVELPEDIVDATNQIRQDCPTGRTAENSGTSSFVATGRGGLPPNPTERIETEDVQVEWYAPDESNEEYVFEDRSDHETVLSTPEAPILEAQAWTLNPNGQYVLIAEPATASIENPAFTNVCP